MRTPESGRSGICVSCVSGAQMRWLGGGGGEGMIEGRGYVEGCGSGRFCLPRYDPSQTGAGATI